MSVCLYSKDDLPLRMFYLTSSPWWLRRLYPDCLWEMPKDDGKIYLTFDDGPHPDATPMVLDMLAAVGAKASFFCIGDNVRKYPEVYQRILREGHRVGNHSYHHLNGWKTSNDAYLEDIRKAAERIDSNIFRPPYGRIRRAQIRALRSMGLKPVMWSLLSGDFDPQLSEEQCAENVLKNLAPGHIVVFHDSKKALQKMQYALPLVLQLISERGWVAEKL
jgi:peptidoglycan-N-acetylglucosamine deacetylase